MDLPWTMLKSFIMPVKRKDKVYCTLFRNTCSKHALVTWSHIKWETQTCLEQVAALHCFHSLVKNASAAPFKLHPFAKVPITWARTKSPPCQELLSKLAQKWTQLQVITMIICDTPRHPLGLLLSIRAVYLLVELTLAGRMSCNVKRLITIAITPQ